MSDLVLAIRLTADGSNLKGELKLSQEELEKLGKAGQRAGEGLEETRQASEEAERETSRLRDTAVALGAVIGAGLVASLAAAVRGLRDFAEAERLGLRLEQVFRATGGAAGVTAGEITELGDAIERATFATTEDVLQAASVLGTFRSISGDTFKRTLVLAQDLSAVFGQSLAGSATQLGKALEDPIEGISALSRVGVTFNDTQKDMISEMVRLGDVAGAQRMILDTLQQQVGGAGAAEAGGLAGAFNSASDAVGNLLEAFGEMLDRELGITNMVLNLAGALHMLTDAANGGGPTTLAEGTRQGVAEVLELQRQIAEAEARGDASRVERLSSQRDALVEHFQITQDTVDQYGRELDAEAAAAAERAQREQEATLQRASQGASQLLAKLNTDLAGLATPAEKLAAVNRTLEEQRGLLAAQRAAGAPEETINAALAAAEELARRQREAIERGASGRGRGASREEERLQAYLDKLRFEEQQLGLTAEQQAVYNNLRAAGLNVTDLLVDASGRLLGSYSLEAEEIGRLTLAIATRTEAQRAAERSQDRQGDLQDQLAVLKLETELVGAGNAERELRLALLEKELELKREGIQLTDEQAQAELRLVEQTVRARQELEEISSTQDEIARIGERAFDRIGSAITQAFADGSLEALDFGQIAKAVLSELLQEMFRIAILNPLKKAFGDLVGGLGGMFSSPAAGPTTTNITSPSQPLFFTTVGSAHSGGIAGQLTTARSVDMSVFASARRYHSGGILPGEVPIIAKQGEEVLTEDDPRHRRNGGGGNKVEVHVHEAPGTKARVNSREEGEKLRLDVILDMVDEGLSQRAAKGGSKFEQTMQGRFGLDRGRGRLA